MAWKLILPLFFASVLAAQPLENGSGRSKVTVAPSPGWVRTLEWSEPGRTNQVSSNEGLRYLLIDFQEHIEREESFGHFVKQIVNEQGVQDNGTLSISFDPSYQELILHRIDLVRQGAVVDQLDLDTVRVTQPENELSRDLYTGDHLATIFLNDLRTGDILDYAYTIRGRNPVMGGHFWSRFYVRVHRPLQRQFYRVVLKRGAPFFQRYHRGEWAPVVSDLEDLEDREGDEGIVEYVWEIPHQPAIIFEDSLPSHFSPYSFMELSNFASWGEVVEWGVSLYPDIAEPLSPAMRELVNTWSVEHEEVEGRCLAALRFVQDDLRYLGIEFGPNSHRPSPPLETLQRRFGDCKDKAYLLCTLLRAMDVEAFPALVHTSSREKVSLSLPSPFAFNHVIVQLRIGDEAIWVDPTASHQGGTLRERHLPGYGKALVIQEGITELTEIPSRTVDGPERTVSESFKVTAYGDPVGFRVESEYKGGEADRMRAFLADTSLEVLSSDYINFYSRTYGDIRTVRPLEISDNPRLNQLWVIESYEIVDFWEVDQIGATQTATFVPHSLTGILTEPDTRLRSMPLGISYPAHALHKVIVTLPEQWELSDKEHVVRDDAFEFVSRQTCVGETVRFEYELRTRSDEVPPDSVPTYLIHLKEVDENFGNSLYRPTAGFGFSIDDLNWIMVFIGACYATLLTAGVIWLGRSRRFRPAPDDPPPLPLPAEANLKGLGGWLILVGLGLVLAPIRLILDIGPHADVYFSTATWQNLAMPRGDGYHPLYGPLLVMELLGNMTLLAAMLLAIALFFSKRALFPKVFIVLALFSLVFLVGDAILGEAIPAIAEQEDSESQRLISRAAFNCLIWIPYMIRSKRVRFTFVR